MTIQEGGLAGRVGTHSDSRIVFLFGMHLIFLGPLADEVRTATNS